MPMPTSLPLNQRRAIVRCSLIGLLLGLSFLTGCKTVAPETYRTPPDVARMAPPPQNVAVAPLDVELAELTASGAVEMRVDWTDEAKANLIAAIRKRTQFEPRAPELASNVELQNELTEVGALVHLMNLNQLYTRLPSAAANSIPPSAATHSFDYNTGALTAHQEHYGEGAVLFIFLRESYATGGRKALAALGLVSAAFTGVYIAPAMGSTVATAALVDHDGTVLWLNQSTYAPDLRTPEGIEILLNDLLRGLPSVPPSDQ